MRLPVRPTFLGPQGPGPAFFLLPAFRPALPRLAPLTVALPRLAPLAVALLSLSCADTTPAKITFTAPPAVILSGKAFPLNASLVNKKDETLPGQAVTCSATPADVLEISTSGTLRCLKTGDATVTLAGGSLSGAVAGGGADSTVAGGGVDGAVAGGGLSQSLAVKCRLPTEIAMPQDLQLILGSAPVPLHARALGEGGRELEDVPVQVTSSDPSVVAVEGDAARAVAVGRARLRASVEEIAAVAPVEVIEKVVSEPLALADGARRSWKLQPGDYLVAIEMKADVRAAQGVTASWEGAACEGQPERPAHRFRCRVNEPATMTVTNPAQIGLGARMTGSVIVYRVPGP